MSKIKLLLIFCVFTILLCRVVRSETCFKFDSDGKKVNQQKVYISEKTNENQTCVTLDKSAKEKVEIIKTSVSLSPTDLNGFKNVIEFIAKTGTQFKVEQALFSQLPALEQVDLSNCSIDSIGDSSFSKNTKLNHLNLAGNSQLKAFDFKIFSQSSKSIEVILPASIETLNINCKETSCRFFPEKNVKKFTNLISFNASNNKESATELLAHIDSGLKKLDLSGTTIDKLSADLLQPYKDVTFLNLSHAKITKIESKPFVYQNKLETLDLSGLKLETVDENLFEKNFDRLQTLKLEHNQLTAADIITREKFDQLKDLAISGNAFLCSYLEKFCETWKGSLNFTKNPSHDKINVNGIDCLESKCTAWIISACVLFGIFCVLAVGGLIAWIVIYRKRNGVNVRNKTENKPEKKKKTKKTKDVPLQKVPNHRDNSSGNYDSVAHEDEEVYAECYDLSGQPQQPQLQHHIQHQVTQPNRYLQPPNLVKKPLTEVPRNQLPHGFNRPNY